MGIARDEHIPQSRSKSRDDGMTWEDVISRAIADTGARVISSTRSENIEDHIDMHVHVIALSIDVKSCKRWEFSRAKPGEIYIELLNVTGKPGWVFGKASHVIFANTTRGTIIVPREALVTLVYSRCGSMKVESSWSRKPELYKYYRRKDRRDAVTLVTEDDILEFGGIVVLD
jgi:hypothetical protein